MTQKNESEKLCLSAALLSVIGGSGEEDKMSVSELIAKFNHSGFGIVLVLFSFPMAIPLPYPPGFTTILGLPLFFVAMQMILGRKDLWLPEYIGKKRISVRHIEMAVKTAAKFFAFFEKFLKPRLEFFSSTNGEKIIGAVSIVCSISIILPIMFGNALPSAGIMIMAMGYLYRDGLAILIGILVSIIGLFVASLVVIFGIAMIKLAGSKFMIMFFVE